MHPFSLEELIIPTATIAILVAIITQFAIKNFALTLVASLIKAGAFLTYFNSIYDGTYTFIDDWVYLERGHLLFRNEINILNLYEKWDYVKMISSGSHTTYYLYNCFAIYLFGDYYFSPVALNIILTAVIAAIGKKILSDNLQLSDTQEKCFFYFLLLHPDIFAWSTVANLKDIVILLLHSLFILSVTLFFQDKKKNALLIAIPTVAILLFSRFYVPIFLLLSLAITIIRNRNFKGQIPLTLLIIAIGILILKNIGVETIETSNSNINQSYDNPLFGFLRMILTPIPFHTEVAYSFLNIPALLHWLMIPALIRGFLSVLKTERPFFKFLTTYFVFFISFYSIYVELQGPRHKVQLDFAIACFQFTGILSFLKYKFIKSSDTIRSRINLIQN